MEEFPANSNAAKKKVAEPDRVIESVVTTGVIRKKPSLGKRFKETFITGDDAATVGEYLIFEILIPAAKDTIADLVTQGVERKLFGSSRSSRRRAASSAQNVWTPYGKISSSTSVLKSESRPVSRHTRANHDFDEIVIPHRVEADRVLDSLYDLLDKYQVATVSDFYALVDVSDTYTDRNWGWTDLRGSEIRRVRDGFVIDLPRPQPIK